MNNSTKSITGELINFRDFDEEIYAALEEKACKAHTLINEADKPTVVDSLREYLIRNVGRFTIIGFYRPSDLSIWYDNEGLIEEFDELMLKFKDYLLYRGIESGFHYKLTRYRDNLHFIMTPGDELEAPLEMIGLDTNPEEERFKETNEELKGCIWNCEDRIQDYCNHNLDVDAFLKELLENNPYMDALVRKHMLPLEE